MSLPRVSLVTPSFNQGAYLEATIRSVLDQDYPDVEYMILDGGSTDSSVDIIRRYEDRLAYWVSEPDGGQTDAINRGFRRATGKYVGWLNSDDMLPPGSIAAAVDYLEANPDVGMVYGNAEYIDSDGQLLRMVEPPPFDYLRILTTAVNYVQQFGSLMRRELFEQVGELDIRLYFAMDLDYWLRLGLVAPIGHIPVTLACFRVHENSKSVAQRARAAPEIPYIWQKLYNRQDLPNRIRSVRRMALAAAHLRAAEYYCWAEQHIAARPHLFRALLVCPRTLVSRRFASLLRRSLMEAS